MLQRVLITAGALLVSVGVAVTLADLGASLAGVLVGSAVVVLLQAAAFTAYSRLMKVGGKSLVQQRELHRAMVGETSRVLYHARQAADAAKRGTGGGHAAAGTSSRPASQQGAGRGPATGPSGAVPRLRPSTVAPSVRAPAHGDTARSALPIAAAERPAWLASQQGGPAYRPSEVTPAHRTAALPFAHEIPVAMIADDFTYNSFKDEFDTRRLTPSNWRDVFEEHAPALFFCESAWQGGPPAEQPWQGKTYASVRWPEENRGELLRILEHCRQHGIPTVFWNKEDPTHFSDRINDFVRTAVLFDYVFTTAEECVEGYLKHAGARHAAVLPFAVQPSLFNPRGARSAEDTVNFAGTWYAMYAERSRRAEKILDLALSTGRDLVIHNRMSASQSELYKYPEKYAPYLRPAIRHEETADVFRRSRFGITLNTVTDSPTMFARRVFELAACGSVVLSNDALGVRNFFGDSVIYADVEPERFTQLDDVTYDHLQRGAMAVALENTYARRAETVLSTVGISFQSRYQKPSGLARVRSMDAFEQTYRAYRDSKALDGLIVAVDPSGEQGLHMELLRRRNQGVTALSWHELADGTLRTRNFLSTHGVVVADPDGRWAADEDIDWLTAHTEYESGVIVRSGAPEGLFRYAPTTDLHGAYVPSAQVSSVFGAADPVAAYHV